MIDSHCHIDQYSDPEKVVSACEAEGIMTIAVTSLPSHYKMALPHLAANRFVHAALGLHPLLVSKHPREISIFESLANGCRLIGEIGIDGSRQGFPTLDAQCSAFDRVIMAISDCKRFVTLHSRGAVKQVMSCLDQHSMYPVVFHWFSGTKPELSSILDAGHYLSFNPAMAQSAKWQSEILNIPLDRILTETDGPYSKVVGKPSRPQDIEIVLHWLATKFGKSRADIEEIISTNFSALCG